MRTCYRKTTSTYRKLLIIIVSCLGNTIPDSPVRELKDIRTHFGVFRRSQTKIIKWPIGTKKIRSHRQLKELPKAREDAGNQVVIGFSFGSDWLREWCEFSGKITTKTKTNAIPDYFRHPIKGCSVSKTLRYNTFPPPPPLTHLTPPTWSSHATTHH